MEVVVVVAGLVMIVAIVFGSFLLQEVLSERRKRLPPPDPIAVLDDRFARGEVDEAEWAKRRAALTYGPPLEIE